MKYNIKDCIVLILFIIIIYLLFTTSGHFTNESFTDDIITEDEKTRIKDKCDDITNNINIILKATQDSVTNNNNFLLQKDVTKFNNINTVNSNVSKIDVNYNTRVNIKYNIDNIDNINTYTPTTKIDIFPNYMIVAYNMVHQYNDKVKGPTIIANYNLPPGWVKCDGRHWYVFTNSETNETTAVNAGFHGLLKEDGKIKPYGYTKPENINTSQYDEIQTIYMQNNIKSTSTINVKHIIAPDLRGRMVCGGGQQNTADDIDKFIFTQEPLPGEKPTTNSIGGQEYVKLDPSHISHRHLTHMAINGISDADNKYFTEVEAKTLKAQTNTTSNNFSKFSLAASITRNPSGNPFVMTTSNFFRDDGAPNHGVPRNNMPPFHTLVYIMKIATIVIPNS